MHKDHFQEAINKATEYTSKADIWYVCDIIGERVFGFALLHYLNKTIPEITRLSNHSNNYIIRSLGAGVHNAVRKGLDKQHVTTVFLILISMANTKDKELPQIYVLNKLPVTDNCAHIKPNRWKPYLEFYFLLPGE